MRTAIWIGGIAILLGVLAVPAVRHWREVPPPPPPALHLAFEAPAGTVSGSGDEALDAAISADEREVVFVASTGGVGQLWRRALATGRTEPLAGTEGAQYPAWKRNGRAIAFFAEGRLRQVSLSDGTITDLADAPAPAGAAWMPDGSLLFAPDARGPVRRMLEGRVTAATTLGPGDRGHVFPATAGDAGSFTYVALRTNGRRTIRLVTPEGERDLADTTGHGQIAGGVLVYARDGVLLSQPVPPGTPARASRSTPLSPSVGISPAGHGMFAASPRLLLLADGPPRPRDLAWLDPRTSQLSRMVEPGDYWQVRISPGDRSAAVTAVNPLLRTTDVFVLPATGAGDAVAVSRAIAADTDPVWSTDGRSVVFRSLQQGRPTLFVRRVGTPDAPDEPVPGSEPGDTPTDWGSRGLLVHTSDGGATGADIFVLRPGTGSREAVAASAFDETDGRWSPDGEWIAYVSNESGTPDVYAVRRTGNTGRVRVSFAGGTRPRWSRDGRSIFFVRGSRIMRADRAAGAAPRFTAAVPVFDADGLRDFDTARESDRLAVLLAAPAAREPSVRAIVDWAPAPAAQ